MLLEKQSTFSNTILKWFENSFCFLFFDVSLQGIFLVYDITSERSFQHIMKWASDVDEVSHTHTHRDYNGFRINRRYARHCTEQKTDRTASCAEPPGRQKERCLTRCDKNQMLRPDAAWLRFIMFHLHCQVPAIIFKQMCAHKYWKKNIFSSCSLHEAVSSALLPPVISQMILFY